MELIYRNKLTWDDLAKIESPWFALSEVKKLLEDGRLIHLQFGQTISDASTKAEQEKFLNDIECGELFMIHDNPKWHEPFSPILRYKGQGGYPLDGRCIMGNSSSGAFIESLVERLYDTKFDNAGDAKVWIEAFNKRRYPPITALMSSKKRPQQGEILEPLSASDFYQGLNPHPTSTRTSADEISESPDKSFDGVKPTITDEPIYGAKVLPDGGIDGTNPKVFKDPKTAYLDADLSRKAVVIDGVIQPAKETSGKAKTMPLQDEAGKTVSRKYKGKTYTLNKDADGFPEFTIFETYLDDKPHINSGDDDAHFKAANTRMQTLLAENPSLKNELGLTQEQVDFFDAGKKFTKPPPDLTWHHHQDTGKIQLVDEKLHARFYHIGGMNIWGGSRP